MASTQPRIILHGGAGNITHETMPPDKLALYRASLLSILSTAATALAQPGARALDVAVDAVAQLEDDPLFNCGRGAVFNRAGRIELEASVMVSSGAHKRGVGAALLTRTRNPIRLAREMLLRGDEAGGGGAGGHSMLSGRELEAVARERWGVEMVDPAYFWTQERWKQHRRGLERLPDQLHMRARGEAASAVVPGDASWWPDEYVPQGTVGAVVLDSHGTVAVATSTGGLTNKLPGRIGDTPTLGAGFWAEEWDAAAASAAVSTPTPPFRILDQLSRGNLLGVITDCLSISHSDDSQSIAKGEKTPSPSRGHHAVALSGTGNGDSFLRLAAARTTAAMARYSNAPRVSLERAVSLMAGPGGSLQESAGDRWGKTGEGEGGIIGIEAIDGTGQVVFDFNRGMFRAYVDDEGRHVFGAFRD
jgi:L-asparaginase